MKKYYLITILLFIAFLLFGLGFWSGRSFSAKTLKLKSSDDIFTNAPEIPKTWEYLYKGDDEISSDFKSSPIDFNNNPEALEFKTALREGIKGGPNFSDHFTIVEPGCGTNCRILFVVNNITGKVYKPEITAINGFSYNVSSRLLIVNPPDKSCDNYGDDPLDQYPTEYYTWEKDHFQLLKKLNICFLAIDHK